MFGLRWRSLPGPPEQRDAAYFGDANGERAGEDDAVEELVRFPGVGFQFDSDLCLTRSLHNVWPGIDHVENQIEGTAAERDIDAVEAVIEGNG